MDFTDGSSSRFKSSRNVCSFVSGKKQQPSVLLVGVLRDFFPVNLCVKEEELSNSIEQFSLFSSVGHAGKLIHVGEPASLQSSVL